ncbi:related to ATP dependent RNA helicase [Cephalotrichum gorgonifer]|uniref:Related to ATP dependent RNA helicase n=1 Tax=Cephalotrichum gorgonifer TaxID=2041049 RepID=A0AAE8MYF8_9PEZI|nr:related to ATP dependent RNA helicase [Cephalotrichum gorgonifer]
MPKPRIIRADTIDLQDHAQPSAQDHSGSQLRADSSNVGRHQAETLREVAHETADENLRSPRPTREKAASDDAKDRSQLYPTDSSSADEDDDDDAAEADSDDDFVTRRPGDREAHDRGVMDQQDALAIAQNGGVQDDSDLEIDGDDLDDDMGGGISSSPSIEDAQNPPNATEVCTTDTLLRPPEAPGHHHHHLDDDDAPALHDSIEEYPDAPHTTADKSQDPPPHGYTSPEHERLRPAGVDKATTILQADDDFVKKRKELEKGEHDDATAEYDSDLLVPYEPSASDDDDDASDLSLLDDPVYVSSEDIDFEYVYALHTFVATVEGQANATKGDTMVLLDDSNSYWWLVRIVKDSSIGYLPAEHIETPTERLARLNKHRNIDLSATMLGDQQEKSKATFKTAIIMRRKKTVTFTAPTYVDYEDVDYSTDEDDQEEIFARQQKAAQQAKEQQASAADDSRQGEDDSEIEDDSAKVEPLKPRAAKDGTGQEEAEETNPNHEKRASEDMFDSKADGVSRSRNGTMRNTDSFFKDDTVETKKITLTPNLLRDDSAGRESTDSKESRTRPSLDKLLDREAAGAKEDKRKKDKDKRPSVIRNFFSRKDKKSRGSADDDEGLGKMSMDSDARDSRDDEAEDLATRGEKGSPQRHPSKLQKPQPRTEPSPTRKEQQKGGELTYVPETRNDVSNVPPATMRIVDSETKETIEVTSASREDLSSGNITQSKGPLSSRSRGDAFKEYGDQDAPNQVKPSVLAQQSSQTNERSPVSPAQASPPASQPPALMGDTSSLEDHSSSPSPDLLDAGEASKEDSREVKEASEAAWDDEKLRAFFDSGTDIRDMLVVVYDKTDVAPAGPDHPIVGGLFREQNAKLAEITTQLDNMLGDWLARKQRLRGAI